jgi:hypothetical protein
MTSREFYLERRKAELPAFLKVLRSFTTGDSCPRTFAPWGVPYLPSTDLQLIHARNWQALESSSPALVYSCTLGVPTALEGAL